MMCKTRVGYIGIMNACEVMKSTSIQTSKKRTDIRKSK